MTQVTTPDNIPSPDLTDQYALTQDMANLADGTQKALIKRANFYLGTSAQRTAFTTAPEGTHWQDTNGSKREYVRKSGVWVDANYDTGWVPLIANTTLYNPGNDPAVRRIGDQVVFKGEFVRKSGNLPTATAGELVFTLPRAEFRCVSYSRPDAGGYGSGTANGVRLLFSSTSLEVNGFGYGASFDRLYLGATSYMAA